MTITDSAPPPTTQPPDHAQDRSRWITLVVLCVGMLMIVLDVTVVNVALPSIQSDLKFTQSSLAWVVNAYLIAFGGLLLLAGRLGDLISRRGVFLAGLGVFTVASLLCGLAQSQAMLVAARFVQGVGGAMTSAVVLGMIVTLFPEPREQAKAIGVYAFVASAGGSIGLLAGGVITQSINWHWIFIVNLPIGIATAAVAMRLLPKDRGIGFGEGADIPGAVLITSALMLLVYNRQAGSGERLGLGPDACARRSLACAPRRVRRARGDGAQSADTAADLSLRERVGRKCDPGADGRGDVRDVLPRFVVPETSASL
jgi:MFS family permease